MLGTSTLVILAPIIKSTNEDSIWSITIPIFLLAIIILGFLVLRLHTRIDSTGIYAKFDPLNLANKKFSWDEIKSCYVRKYSPLTEYGGWGIRGFPKAKAYNVSGNMGIQLVTKAGKKFLIGTNKPEQAQKVIDRYRDKIKI